ncbi:MAG: Na+/H+ antiporter NhaC [Alphaproteobacteria bacterium]
MNNQTKQTPNGKDITFGLAVIPILVLVLLLVTGLALLPLAIHGSLNEGSVALETIFLLAITFAVFYMYRLGFSWKEIQESAASKVKECVPALMILFAIGVLIGSWIISGTIPMLVYYGIKMINPHYMYIAAFLVPIVFSMLTGTSWGSAGTIGVVIMGVAIAIDANLAITAGAVVGGSYFGDKLSPLSDTTNFAAMGAEVDLYDHIKSMLYTTTPATIIAITLYAILGFTNKPAITSLNDPQVIETLNSLHDAFNFNIILLVPPLIVLLGAFTRKPTAPTLIVSSLVAVLIGLFIQSFSVIDTFNALKSGFSLSMVQHLDSLPQTDVLKTLQRGGLYNLIEGIVVAMMVFTFLGVLELIDAVSIMVKGAFAWIKGARTLVITTLISTGITNALTANQTAVSFLIGGIFRKKYDDMGIQRRVLSRSIEDNGTLLESLLPWHPTGIFMALTLGVPVAQYAQFQFLSLANIAIAFLYAIFGLFIFKVKDK